MSVLLWVLWKVFRVVLDLSVVLLVLAILPGIPPNVPCTTLENIPLPLPLEGVLARNNILDNAQRILDGKIVGPESIASRHPEEVFVSLHGGKILRIYGPMFDHFKIVTSIGPGCDASWEEEVCGRPLGLRFAPDGKLLVADAYLGLFSVDVETGENERLFDIGKEIEGAVAKISNDLDIDSEGFIYWSDASSLAPLNRAMIEMIASPSGRLLKFDPATKSNTVLVRNLHFANGVQLAPDHSFVLVCETFMNRVHRHWLRGPRAGQTEIFVERLPGMPDNIRSNGQGGYYVSLVSINRESISKMNIAFRKLPILRRLGLRLLYLTRLLLETIGKLDSTRYIEAVAHKILHLAPVGEFNLKASNLTIVVEVDGDGKILGSLQGNSGKLVMISETQRVGEYMFFGSPFNKYLGMLLVESPLMDVEGKGVRKKSKEEKMEDSLNKENGVIEEVKVVEETDEVDKKHEKEKVKKEVIVENKVAVQNEIDIKKGKLDHPVKEQHPKEKELPLKQVEKEKKEEQKNQKLEKRDEL